MTRFTGLEIVEAWTPGSPQVLYRPEVPEALGVPEVDYDDLGRYFTDVLQVPREFDVEILLHGMRGAVLDRLFGHALGSYSLFRPHKIWVNAVKAEMEDDPRMKTMGVVAHEGRHLSDRVNHPVRTFTEITFGAKEKYEHRARAQQNHDSLKQHQNDISFPRLKSV